MMALDIDFKGKYVSSVFTRRQLLKNGSVSFAAFATASVVPKVAVGREALFPTKRPEPSARKFQCV
jgi:hypothetical protein